MNSLIRIFNYRFYVKEFLLLFFTYLLMENIFSWLCLPNSIILLTYEKLLSIVLYGFMLYKFTELKTSEKIYLGLFTAILVRMVFESMYKFNNPFQQFTLFTVLFPVVYTIFIKYILRKYNFDVLEFIAKFYILTYILIMVIYGRGFSFSLDAVDMDDYGPFSGDSRVVHARSIFTMIIPFLWYLHRYITTKKANFLIPFAFCFVVILVHQHRSVWSSTCVSLFFYIIGTILNRKASIQRFSTLAAGSVAVLLICGFFVSNMFPGFIDFLADRFSEIFDPAKEGSTGNFRIQQRETYFELFLERPVFGWTFDGFELPNPLVDWWPEKTGQHFHEGYIEMLFYHGVVGLVLKYSFLVYLLYRAFTRNLSEHSIILISFCLAGITFSFNYVLPLVFWGHVGMCLFYLEKDDLKVAMKAAGKSGRLSASKTGVLKG